MYLGSWEARLRAGEDAKELEIGMWVSEAGAMDTQSDQFFPSTCSSSHSI
jgi:hypothetical protein